MKTIEIHSLPISEVLHDLSTYFGSRCIKICDEYIVKIPSSWGTGYIKGASFSSGLGIIQYLCKFKSDVEIKLVVNNVHPVKFLYCLNGYFEHRFQNSHDVHTLNQYQNAIVASHGKNGHILHFKAKTNTNLCSLEINRKEFKPLMDCYLQKSLDELQYIFRDESAKKSFYHEGMYSFLISGYFDEINSFMYNGLIKRTFMEAKAFQILTSQLIQYEDDMLEGGKREVFRHAEVKSLEKAVRIIALELENLESVHSLANRVGLNQNKLQDGFHKMYSLSVNAYIMKERLKLAVLLLKNTNISMMEIMERLGLRSQSYFSKIFKDNFGQSPSKFRKKNTAKSS